jgi:hypothetical protein
MKASIGFFPQDFDCAGATTVGIGWKAQRSEVSGASEATVADAKERIRIE